MESRNSFSWALQEIKCGRHVRRSGWNGVGIFITLQTPDIKSKMTSPYIYITTTELQASTKHVPKVIVPWIASQTDLLADDWEILGIVDGLKKEDNK